jgi:uroporphyrinogen-III synthase
MHELCLEAVRQRGTDVEAIESYIRERIAGMPEHEKLRLRDEIARVLAFRPPPPGTGSLQ